MKHWGWWLLGGLFFLSQKPSVITPAGGMNPVQPTDGMQGTAIDAATGLPVTVNQPLQTTVVGTIAPPTTLFMDGTDEAFLQLPMVPQNFTGGPQRVGPIGMVPPIAEPMVPGTFLQNPDTLPNAWPGLGNDAPPAQPAGDPRGGSAMVATPLFDLTKDSFIVPGLGEEDFSPGALTADAKLAILRQQGYTGPDPRMVAATPLAAAQDMNPLVNPATGRVSIGNV